MIGDTDFIAVNNETITVDNTAGGKSLTATVTSGGATRRGQRALLTLETAEIRFTYDGTAPTTTVGHVMSPGDRIELIGYASINAFRAIRTGATSGTLQATLEVY